MLPGLVLTDALILTDKVAVPTHVDTLWHKIADWKLARFHALENQMGDLQKIRNKIGKVGRVFPQPFPMSPFERNSLNGTGANPNSESATAKGSLTILSKSPIPGLVKPNSESPELDASAKYKQPVHVFLHCIPDSCLLCYPTPICKICHPQPQRDLGRGVKYLRRQIENVYLPMVGPNFTWNTGIGETKTPPMICPEENFTWRHLALALSWLPSPPQHWRLEVVVAKHLDGR